MRTPKEAMDFLAEQPDIAAYLREHGFKGKLYASSHCPVAKYLSKEAGEQCYCFQHYSSLSRSGAEIEVTPTNVLGFILDFDDGKYPDLIAP